jgi:hypothetical protein
LIRRPAGCQGQEDVLSKNGGGDMKGMIFVALWIGCAALHTLYELKIKPFLDNLGKDSRDVPFR